MKKTIFTLVLCLAFSSSTVMAAQKCTKNVKKCPIKATKQVKKTQPVRSPEELAQKQFEEKMAKKRSDLYSQLNMSKEQIEKAEKLNTEKNVNAAPLANKMITERAKLKELKTQKASEKEISQQRQTVKEAYKTLNVSLKKSLKEFENILTDEQLAKFKEIKKNNKQKIEE